MMKNRRSSIRRIYLKLLTMKTKKFWFTLIELLISISIIWILVVILFRAYNTISQVTFRIQQEKNIQQEMIRIAQTLQNIADKNTIDFEKYNDQQNKAVLFLSGEGGNVSITSTGVCISDSPALTWFTQEQKENPCQLIIINQDWKTIPITTPTEVIISKPNFTIIPTKNKETILENNQISIPFLFIQQPGFQITFKLYTPLYNKSNWTQTSSLFFQQFFNLQAQ